jgi:CDP-glucose 4,6-dehydratase
VLDLVTRIAGLMGSTLAPDVQNMATGEIPVQRLSSTKARDVLGWRPTYALDEGLGLTIRWYERFFQRQHGGHADG